MLWWEVVGRPRCGELSSMVLRRDSAFYLFLCLYSSRKKPFLLVLKSTYALHWVGVVADILYFFVEARNIHIPNNAIYVVYHSSKKNAGVALIF